MKNIKGGCMSELTKRVFEAIRPKPLCKDCADSNDRCPNSNELCDPIGKAIEIRNEVEALEQKNEALQQRVDKLEKIIDAYEAFFSSDMEHTSEYAEALDNLNKQLSEKNNS